MVKRMLKTKKKITLMLLLIAMNLLSHTAHARFVGLASGEETPTVVSRVGAPIAFVKNWFSRFQNYFVGGVRKEVKLPADVLSKKDLKIPSLAKVASEIKKTKIVEAKTQGVAFRDSNLILGHNSVPVFEFKKFKARTSHSKIKQVPLLNIGHEAVLKLLDSTNLRVPLFETVAFESLNAFTEPGLASSGDFQKNILGEPVLMAKDAEKTEIPYLEPDQKVTSEKIAKMVYNLEAVAAILGLPTVRFGADDLKLLRGLILFEKKDQCHIASGIFSDLISEAASDDIKLQSHYLLGLCLHEMNLPTEALFHLKKVIRSGSELYIKGAIKAFVEDLPSQYQSEAGELLTSLKSDNFIVEDVKPLASYFKAKYLIKHAQPQRALEQALKVPSKHLKYYQAQYLASVAEYELGKLEAAIERERSLASDLIHKGTNKDILALIQVNLGRIAFEKGKYKESLDAFQRVPKEHALWLQALTEQAWTQLQSKDALGAVGNMHSIQSPYFDGVFKPESYIVRAIGYLNICQYPDAFKSIAYLEHIYEPWLNKITAFNKSGKDPYEVVLKQLQGKGAGDVDGLPFQIIRETARQRDFLNLQESMNQLIDEKSGYGFIKGLIEKDRRSLLVRRNAAIAKVGQLKTKISNARKTPNAMKDFNAWRFELASYEDFLNVYEFKVQTLKEGVEGFAKLTPVAQERIAVSKDGLRKDASNVLHKHLLKMASDLKRNLENDELLKYEIYAGSGENLRYKVAGGKSSQLRVGSLQDRKPSSQKWDFAGEFWEDEIGNYRSSLKNNCQAGSTQAGTAREAK
jgi:tetratricopeptide (TPR) repeat protein